MFNLGPTEIFMIAAMALLFFGPDRLPDFARLLAKGLREARRVSAELNLAFRETVRGLETDGAAPLPDLRRIADSLDPREPREENPARLAFGSPAPGSHPGVVVEAPTAGTTAGAVGVAVRSASVPLDQVQAAAAAPADEVTADLGSTSHADPTVASQAASTAADSAGTGFASHAAPGEGVEAAAGATASSCDAPLLHDSSAEA